MSDQAPFILLITDRVETRRALVRGIEAVMLCRAATPEQVVSVGRPQLAVIDLAPEAVERSVADLAQYPGGTVPYLVLHRDASSKRAGLPPGASHAAILTGIFTLLETEARRRKRLHAMGAAAFGIVSEIFDSAALGAGLQQVDADRGTDIVLEVVSEIGIGEWLATIWQHDAGIYQHTLGVAGYAAAFGARIGLAQADRRRLTKAALLHDIGKSRIPSEILNKPGPLNAEEMRLMRRHPDIGADLLLAQGGWEPAIVEVVRHHHEKLDGTGYPGNLAAAAVSDLVRIVAVCDVFSALTERRTYRSAMRASDALATMARMRGHLDPALLRAFGPVALGGTADRAAAS